MNNSYVIKKATEMDVEFDELLNLKMSETEQIGIVSLNYGRKNLKHYGQSLGNILQATLQH